MNLVPAILLVILVPVACMVTFWLGSHFTYRLFTDDDRFSAYIWYHRTFEKLMNLNFKKKYKELKTEEEYDGKSEEDTNGGY